jgi:hypothetical protein
VNKAKICRRVFLPIIAATSLSTWAAEKPPLELKPAESTVLKGGLPAEVEARIAADLELHERIDSIELIPGPEGPKGDPGDSGILFWAGKSCAAGEAITGFDLTGDIVCTVIRSPDDDVVGGDCAHFLDQWLNFGVLGDNASADLRGCDLRGLSIANFNYQGTDFSGADLRGVRLESVNLEDTDFSGANLEGAYLVDSDLRRANFSDANLSHANMARANFNDAIIDRAIFTGANLVDVVAFPDHPDQYQLPVRPAFGDTICPDGSSSFVADGDLGTCNNNR